MAVTLSDVSRRLRELIAALDRRTPRAERATEDAIARDAAALRERAVHRLEEIAEEPASPNGPLSEPDEHRSAPHVGRASAEGLDGPV